MMNPFDEKKLQQAKKLVNTSTGRQLMDAMRKADANALEKASAQASAGNYSQLAETLAPILASEEVKALLKQMGG